VCAASSARAQTRVDSGPEWRQKWIGPADDVEQLEIDNRLGPVAIEGWDRNEVQVTAVKRAASPDILGRLRVHVTKYDDGRMTIDTRVKLEQGELILPLGSSRVELTIAVPRGVRLGARTWSGDLAAAGLRGGAHLETDAGRIDVNDVTGAVVTKGRRSNQRITLIRGDVDVDDLEGDVVLTQVTGNRVEARLVRGTLRADRVLARWVKLQAMMGRVEFVLGESGAVDLRARAQGRVVIDGVAQTAPLFRGVLGGGPMRVANPESRVELVSYGGDVLISVVSARFDLP
jgi:hypothetical protein